MVIDIHTHVSTIQPSDPFAWKFFQARFCNASIVLTIFVSGPALNDSTPRGPDGATYKSMILLLLRRFSLG